MRICVCREICAGVLGGAPGLEKDVRCSAVGVTGGCGLPRVGPGSLSLELHKSFYLLAIFLALVVVLKIN